MRTAPGRQQRQALRRHGPDRPVVDARLEESLGAGKEAARTAILGEVEHWCLRRPDGKDVLAGFHALATL